MPPSVPKVFIEYIINILRNLVNIYIQGQKSYVMFTVVFWVVPQVFFGVSKASLRSASLPNSQERYDLFYLYMQECGLAV